MRLNQSPMPKLQVIDDPHVPARAICERIERECAAQFEDVPPALFDQYLSLNPNCEVCRVRNRHTVPATVVINLLPGKRPIDPNDLMSLCDRHADMTR